jgi:hypothetical protein
VIADAGSQAEALATERLQGGGSFLVADRIATLGAKQVAGIERFNQRWMRFDGLAM